MKSRLRYPRLIFGVLLVLGCSTLPKRGRDHATVVIGQPTVFLRERSLVERFEDLEWLRLQRSPEKEAEYEQGFQGSVRTATAEFTGLALKAQLGKALLAGDGDEVPDETAEPEEPAEPALADVPAPSEPDDDQPSDSPSPEAVSAFAELSKLPDAELAEILAGLNASKPSISPRDLLANRLAFRDAVAEEIRKRSLDDVHDLAGMALYELQFNLSIFGGANSGDSYAVMLEVQDQTEVQDQSIVQDQTAYVPENGVTEHFVDRVFATLNADCLAKIEETTERFSRGWLLADEPGTAQEAVLRGTLAARLYDVTQLRKAVKQALESQSSAETLATELDVVLGELPLWPTPSDLQETAEQVVGTLPLSQLSSLPAKIEKARMLCVESLRDLVRRQEDLKVKLSSAVSSKGTNSDDSLIELNRQFEGALQPKLLAFPPLSSIDPSGQIRGRNDVQDEALSLLLRNLENGPLQSGQLGDAAVSSIQRLLKHFSQSRAQEYAKRALGFVIARKYADRSGGALDFKDDLPTAGLDARVLLPVLFEQNRGQVKEFQAAAQKRSAPDARVVSVTPAEAAEQVTSSAYSDTRKSLSLVASGAFGGTVTAADAAFQNASRALSQYEFISRNSLIVGFVGGKSSGDAASNTFGWVLGPRLETSTSGKATLRYRHGAENYPVTATLIAPVSLRNVTLQYKVFRIGNDGRWTHADSIPDFTTPEFTNPRQRTKHSISVDLPVTPEAVAFAFLRRNQWKAQSSRPQVFAARSKDTDGELRTNPWRLEVGAEKQALIILGKDLWRNPQVYVGAQRASRVQILPDLGGLWAEFAELQAPPGQNGKPVMLDLVISTSRGSDRLLGAVEVLPKKKPASEPKKTMVTPALQVVTTEVIPASKDTAEFDLSFDITPPLSRQWSELQVRFREPGTAVWHDPVTIQPVQLRFDAKKPTSLAIKDVKFKQGDDWSAVETWEVELRIQRDVFSEPVAVNSSPLRVAFVQAVASSIASGQAVASKTGGVWKVTKAIAVRVRPTQDISPAYAKALLPEDGKASVRLDGVSSIPCSVSIEDGGGAAVWVVTFPAGASLDTAAALPSEKDMDILVGSLTLQAKLQLKEQ